MAYKTWKEAYNSIVNEDDVKEVRYTNVYNKIKGIKNLKRAEADMIASIDPFILGKVVKALAPFYEDVNEEVISEKIQYKGYPTKYAALHGQLGLKTLAQAKAVDHLIVAGGKKPDQIAKILKNFGPSQFQDIVNLLNVSTKPKDLKDTEKKLKAGFHHESVKEATDVFDKAGITVSRFSMGAGKVGIQLSMDKKAGMIPPNDYIKFDGNYLGRVIDALKAAQKRGMK